MTIQDNRMKALVYGSEVYEIEIHVKEGSIKLATCECPYASNGYLCKDMAAVMFEWENEGNNSIPFTAEKSEQNDIVNLIEKTDVNVIRQFLTELLNQDDTLLYRFKRTLNIEITNEDMHHYKEQINDIFQEHTGYHEFIDYHSAREFLNDIGSFFEHDIQTVLISKRYQEALELTNYLFIRLRNQDMDDSDGGTVMIAQLCKDIWVDILNSGDENLRQILFQWLMEHNGSVIDYMGDFIEEILFEEFQEDTYLQENFIYIFRLFQYCRV